MPKKNQLGEQPKQKRLSLRAEADSALGQVIAYLQSISPNERELVSQTLLARFLPFVLDKEDPVAAGMLRQCLAQCLAYQHAICLWQAAKLIALEWDLPVAGVSTMQEPTKTTLTSECTPESKEVSPESLNSSQADFFSLVDQMGG